MNRPKYFHIQSLSLSVMGAYLVAEKNSVGNRLRSSINSVLSIVLLLSQFYAAQEALDDLRFLCHILGLVVGILLSVIKVLGVHFHIHDFAEMNHLLTELSVRVSPDDRVKLQRANKLGQTLSFLNITCLLTSTLSLILYPLGVAIYQYSVTDSPDTINWPTPFGAKLPFDASYTPVFELVYLFMIYSFVMVSFAINASDSFFVEASVLLVCHFQFLRRDIEQLDYETLDEEMRRTFAYHSDILRAKESLQKAYSTILPFFVVIAPTLFGLFVISALRSPGVTVFKSLGYAISSLCQISFYNYGGEIIHSESTSIVKSYYDSDWYEARPEQRKQIITAMILAQSGTRIKAGMFELSLNTFARIISSTFTVITVLSSVFD